MKAENSFFVVLGTTMFLFVMLFVYAGIRVQTKLDVIHEIQTCIKLGADREKCIEQYLGKITDE